MSRQARVVLVDDIVGIGCGTGVLKVLPVEGGESRRQPVAAATVVIVDVALRVDELDPD